MSPIGITQEQMDEISDYLNHLNLSKEDVFKLFQMYYVKPIDKKEL